MKKLKILIISGPNLNMIGQRQKQIYGDISLFTFFKKLKKENKDIKLTHFFSNSEGYLISKIQKLKNKDALIINLGGLSHTSVSLRDALLIDENIYKVNLHISNILEREDFRQKDLIKDIADYNIVGMGLDGYKIAIEHIKSVLCSRRV